MHDFKVAALVFELDLIVELHPLKDEIYLLFFMEVSQNSRAVRTSETDPDDIAFLGLFGQRGLSELPLR